MGLGCYSHRQKQVELHFHCRMVTWSHCLVMGSSFSKGSHPFADQMIFMMFKN